MDKRLREVASELPLAHVVLLAEEPRWPTGRARALEPAGGGHPVAGDALPLGHHEAAQKESSFRVTQRPRVVSEAIHVAVLDELVLYGAQRRQAARVIRRHGAPNRGHQQ